MSMHANFLRKVSSSLAPTEQRNHVPGPMSGRTEKREKKESMVVYYTTVHYYD
jgi:hypothetical protein